jgi:predicted TIM-barrel fold metal-dependent hydrolase
MNTDCPIISADSHIQEPPELYEERLPKRFRHRIPHIETRADGSRYRIIDGKRPRRLDLAEQRADQDDQNREFRRDPSGGRDIEQRLRDQRRDGVSAEVIYPNQSLFIYNSPDPAYQLAVAKAYNDWLMEIFGAHRDRFAPVACVPVADVATAVAEAERVAKLGYRTIKIPITVAARPYNDRAYERLWAVCEEAGLVVSFHAFTNSEDQYPEDWGEEEGVGGALNLMAMSMVDGMSPVSLLISSGALMRHPKLEFVVVECGAGWLAWLLYVLDEQNEKKHMWIRPRLDRKPSEYFARQGHVTFSDDPVALRNLEFTGARALLWGSDYPHDEGTFPHSREVIERTFAGVAEPDKRKIVGETAAELYGFARHWD